MNENNSKEFHLEEDKKKRKKYIIIILFILFFLGLGYAYLQALLSITGSAGVSHNSWSIYFDENSSTVESSGEGVSISNVSFDDTDVTFEVHLSKPGDYIEGTMDIVNDGTIDAMIDDFDILVNNSETLPPYLIFSVTYSGGAPLADYQYLHANSRETLELRVEYNKDITSQQLPDSQESLDLEFSVDYVQANGNAVEIQHVNHFATDDWETIISNVHDGKTSIYRVGDTKEITLENGLGTHTLRIANKSTSAECSIEGFSQTACGFVIEFADAVTMTDAGYSNVDGWPETFMYSYLNDTSDSTSIINSIPEPLRSAIIDTFSVSGHGTSDSDNFTSTDKLYLLSTHEVWEDDDGDTNAGIDYYDTAYHQTRQLDYYRGLNVTTTNCSRSIKQNNGSNTTWWLRSAFADNNRYYYCVSDIGSSDTCKTVLSKYISPAFRLG